MIHHTNWSRKGGGNLRLTANARMRGLVRAAAELGSSEEHRNRWLWMPVEHLPSKQVLHPRRNPTRS